MWRKTLLKKVKSYIGNHLNPAKKNIIDPRKTLGIPEKLAKLQIDGDSNYRAGSISKDDHFELYR